MNCRFKKSFTAKNDDMQRVAHNHRISKLQELATISYSKQALPYQPFIMGGLHLIPSPSCQVFIWGILTEAEISKQLVNYSKLSLITRSTIKFGRKICPGKGKDRWQ